MVSLYIFIDHMAFKKNKTSVLIVEKLWFVGIFEIKKKLHTFGDEENIYHIHVLLNSAL